MTSWPNILSAQFGMFHSVITNKTIDSKHNYTKSLTNVQQFSLINDDDVNFPRPHITFGHYCTCELPGSQKS